MSQTNLKELGKELKTLTKIANANPNKVEDPQKRRMMLGNITQAKEKLQVLQLEYRKQIMSKAIFILVTGGKAKDFIAIAEKSCGCFTVNAENLYKELIQNTPEALYVNKTSSGNLLEFIANNLEDKARALNITSYPAIFMESKYKKVLTGKDDLLALTKAVINDKVGGELVGLYAVEQIASKLLKSKNNGTKVPIAIRVDDSSIVEEVAKGIKRSLSDKTFIIGTEDLSAENEKFNSILFDVVVDISEETVETSLTKLNKTLNK